MAFMCPKLEENERKRANLTAVADIANELAKEYDNVYCEGVNMPPCCCCGGTQGDNSEPPNCMVCYKIGKAKNSSGSKAKKGNRTNADPASSIPMKQSKSRELRGSEMYVGCDCEKRNGLQDGCRRTECNGSPECLTLPNPTCGPSQFSNGKHLGKPYPYIGSGARRGVAGGAQDPNAPADPADATEYEYQCFPANLENMTEAMGAGGNRNCVCVTDEAGNYTILDVNTFIDDQSRHRHAYQQTDPIVSGCRDCCANNNDNVHDDNDDDDDDSDQWEYAFYPMRGNESSWYYRCKHCWRPMPLICSLYNMSLPWPDTQSHRCTKCPTYPHSKCRNSHEDPRI